MRWGVPDVETWRDFNSYYRGGIVGMPEGGRVRVFYIEAMVDENTVAVNELDPASWSFRPERMPLAILWNRMGFGLPDVGMTDSAKSIQYLSLIASRNSHRGLNDNRIDETRFCDWDESEDPDFNSGVARNVLTYNIFNPVNRTLDQGLTALTRGEYLGRRLTSKFGVYLSSNSRYPVLAYKRNACGYVQDGRVMLFRRYSDLIPTIGADIGARAMVV